MPLQVQPKLTCFGLDIPLPVGWDLRYALHGSWAQLVPRAYQPPLPRRPQVVETAPRRGRRGWLLLPLLGLVPLFAAVLASELPFRGSPFGVPQAAAPQTTVIAVQTPAAAAATPAAAARTTQAIPAPPVATSAPTARPTSAPAATSGNSAAATATPAARTSSTASTSGTAASAATGPFAVYRVQAGDTVKIVAEKFGVSPQSVSNASGLTNPDQLKVGQVLTIPNQTGWLYRVQAGETLDQIAARTGVSSDTIATVSNLTAASVRAGDVILIPDLNAARGK